MERMGGRNTVSRALITALAGLKLRDEVHPKWLKLKAKSKDPVKIG
jgi:hypothetical protein